MENYSNNKIYLVRTGTVRLLIATAVLAFGFVVFPYSANAATLHVVAAGGNLTLAGTYVENQVPTSADDVIIGAGVAATRMPDAGTLTFKTMNMTGYTGTLDIRGSTWNAYGNVTLGGTIIDAPTSKIVFMSTASFTSNGQDVCNIWAQSGTLTFQDNYTTSTSGIIFMTPHSGATITFANNFTTNAQIQINSDGTLNANGKTLTLSANLTVSGGTALLTLGSGTITTTAAISISAGSINLGTGTINTTGAWSAADGTVIRGTSTINFTAAGANPSMGANAYYNVNFTGGGVAGTVQSMSGAATFSNLSIIGTAVKYDEFQFANNITVTGTLTLKGNTNLNRLLVRSATLGSRIDVTNTGATMVWQNVDFMDFGLTTAYNASAITGLSGDCGGNNNITFTSGQTDSWTVKANGSWSDVTKWAGRVPLPQDSVTIGNDWSGQVITADMPRLGKNIVWNGTGAITWALNSPNVNSYTIYGSLDLTGLTTLTQTKALYFGGRGASNLNMNGLSFNNVVTFQMVGGTMALTGVFTKGSTGVLTFANGTFNASTYNVNLAGVNTINSGFILNMGAGNTWTLSGTGNIWNCDPGATINAGSSTISITNTSSSSKTFAGGSKTYGSMNITGGGTGAVIITGSNTFANLPQITGGNQTLTIAPSTTQTFTGGTGFGNGNHVITINTSTSGTHATFFKSSGVISADYLSVKDIYTGGGAQWYAGSHSTNVSGNNGWLFTAPHFADSYTYPYPHPAPWIIYNNPPINPLPNHSATFPDYSQCYYSNGTSYICYSSVNTSYLWSFGDGTPNATTKANTSHTYAQPGPYMTSLKICDEFSCCTASSGVIVGPSNANSLPKWWEISPY